MRSARPIVALVLVALNFVPSALLGQVLPAAPADSTGAETSEPYDPPFSPRGAFFRSLVLPGWGQAHVGAPGRGAVYFALVAGTGWMTYLTRQQLSDARAEEQWLRDIGAIDSSAETDFALARSQHFEDWAALTIFLMFLSGADAYVSAYLADFGERVEVRTAEEGGLRLETRIPVGGRP